MTAASRCGSPSRRGFPTLDLGKVATDLANAIGEGINNALALVGAPPPLSILACHDLTQNQRMRYRPPNQRTRIFRSRRLRPKRPRRRRDRSPPRRMSSRR